MQTIYFTKKLEKLINTTTIDNIVVDPDNCWSAHLVALAGRKNILFTHKKTLYSVLLIDVLKKDMKFINTLFYTAFIQQLKVDQIYNPEIDKLYIQHFSTLQFETTDNDRKTMGTMNDIIYNLKTYCMESLESEQVRPLQAARHFAERTLNNMPLGSRKYSKAKVLLLEEIKSIYLGFNLE